MVKISKIFINKIVDYKTNVLYNIPWNI